MNVSAIVLAAGTGTRFGSTKQHAVLADRQLWRHGFDTLGAAGIVDIVVVGPVAGGVPGGERRRDSVAAGLSHVPVDSPLVLVHDAARPLVTIDLVARVIGRLVTGDVDGVVPVVPLPDTIKLHEGESVIRTVDRTELVAAQTPQGFKVDVLRRAHREVAGDATDDASMVESIGGAVVTVEGEARNLKVTYPEDLVMAAALLSLADD